MGMVCHWLLPSSVCRQSGLILSFISCLQVRENSICFILVRIVSFKMYKWQFSGNIYLIQHSLGIASPFYWETVGNWWLQEHRKSFFFIETVGTRMFHIFKWISSHPWVVDIKRQISEKGCIWENLGRIWMSNIGIQMISFHFMHVYNSQKLK